ncbi:MAG: hypothetical protein GXO83_05430 [Chlorobi bacterium]|nr:hypothetical protein [Chlorobiota bacterium]
MKKRNKIKNVVVIVIIFFQVSGCAILQKRNTNNTITMSDLIKTGIIIKSADFRECNGNKKLFKGYIKYIGDSAFVMTAISNQGIVSGRIYVWKDSLLIINRINRLYYKESGRNGYLREIKNIIIEGNKKSGSIKWKQEGVLALKYYLLSYQNGINTYIRIEEKSTGTCINISLGKIEISKKLPLIIVKENLKKSYRKVNKLNEIY